MQTHPDQPEILAPAGDWDCLRAAIENGADAVYFGLQSGFNARARAANFEADELDAIIQLLHSRGVKGFVTLNTLIFPSELPLFEAEVRRVAAAGVDAVLVQDIGAVQLIRRVCPELPIHASTQMTLTSGECIAEAESMGVERVVLARELSIKEIRDIRSRTSVELEVFVHGALCVAYSGQCLTSESLGGRSANRGQCAQACRLPYELTCDGEDVDLGDQKYLLSPQDLAAYAFTPDLIDAGVCSFKIEGRLKTPEYVANITRHYRDAAAQAASRRLVQISDQAVEEMELSFSRGFSPGWLQGCDHKMLVPALSSAKRGVLLGRVVAVGNRVRVRLERSVCKGDGIVFAGDRDKGEEQGSRVYAVFQNGERRDNAVGDGEVELSLPRESIDLEQLYPGQEVWKTDDPRLTSRLRKTFAGPDPIRRVDIHIEVSGNAGAPLKLVVSSDHFDDIHLQTPEPLEAARKHPLTSAVLVEQLGRLGAVEFRLASLYYTNDGAPPMAPLSVLGQLRKKMIQQMRAAINARPGRNLAVQKVLPQLREQLHVSESITESPQLTLLCRTLTQLRTAIEADADVLMADFQDIREYREAVEVANQAGRKVWLATPRIQKPGEMGIFEAIRRREPAGILVRNFSGLRYCLEHNVPFVADFSLNAANELTVDYLLRRGAQRVTASYDLNRDQLLDLVNATPARDSLEVVVHQHMPMFHMEHCVFCAVLSPGTNKTNCGRPCDDHQVELRDRVGVEHPLTADVGCRNTLYNATAQSGSEMVPALLDAGVRNFRIELLRHGPKEVRRTLAAYRSLLPW